MKINQCVRYGAACLFELSKSPTEYLGADTIAARQHVPAAFAHKILQSLARTGLVYSMKGSGYRLARPLSEISANDLINATCAETDMHIDTTDIGRRLDEKIGRALDTVTLADIFPTNVGGLR